MMTALFIFYYIFGILLYDCIPQIQLIDEVIPWILFIYAVVMRKGKLSLSFIIFGAISLFYLAYSFYIHSNVPKAIIFDFIVQVKPFVTFFSVMMIAPLFTIKEMKAIRYTMIAGAILIFIVGITRVGEEVTTVQGEILTGARLSFAALYSGVSYMVFSNGSTSSMIIAFIIMLFGLLVPTSKFFAGIGIIVMLFLFALPSLKKYRALMIMISVAIILIFIYLTADDFALYLLSDDTARAVMYLTSGLILKDYIPFGSGLASFGTSASANYYSSIYPKYGIDIVFGLSESDVEQGQSFISDTGIVSLAQFGIIGILLFVFLCIIIIKKSIKMNSIGFNILVIFIIMDIIIESVADSCFIGNRGVLMVMLMGILMSHHNNHNMNTEYAEKN